jgi:hypothetical protein
MKHLISYSLYGDNPRYTVGAIKNAALLHHLPDFTARFYVGESVPSWVISTLECFDNVEIWPMIGAEDSRSMFWRFYALADINYDYILVRDCDARFNARELTMHREFVESGKDFHIIKDHPTGHNYLISGGLFAAKKVALHDIHKLIFAWEPKNSYGDDMAFLHKIIYPRIIGDAFIHDEYFNTPMSTKCKLPKEATLDMVGAALDENDRFIYDNDQKMSLRENGGDVYRYHIGTPNPQGRGLNLSHGLGG